MDPIQQPNPTPETPEAPVAPETPEADPVTTPTPEATQAPAATPETTSQEVTPAPVAQPAAATPAAADPGKTLGIVGFVMSILGFGLISLVMSIIAKSQSKKAGFSNGFALAGIIISAVTTVLGIILFATLMMAGGAALQFCSENPNASECSSSYESTYQQ